MHKPRIGASYTVLQKGRHKKIPKTSDAKQTHEHAGAEGIWELNFHKRYVGTKRNVLYQKELVVEINLLKLLLHMLNFQSMTMKKHQELFKRHVIYLNQYNLPSTSNFHVPIFENQFGGGSLINHSSLASINNFIGLV
jgi:hypothetical protein